jgi:hypothetical protein
MFIDLDSGIEEIDTGCGFNGIYVGEGFMFPPFALNNHFHFRVQMIAQYLPADCQEGSHNNWVITRID